MLQQIYLLFFGYNLFSAVASQKWEKKPRMGLFLNTIRKVIIMAMSILWAVIAAGLAILELSVGTLVCIWFAVGCLAGMVASRLSAPIWLQLILFLVASTVCLLAVRPILLKKMKFQPKEMRGMVGKHLIVTEAVKDGSGVGLLGDVTWRLKAKEEIEEGKEVEVTEVKGTTLYVKEIKKGVIL